MSKQKWIDLGVAVVIAGLGVFLVSALTGCGTVMRMDYSYRELHEVRVAARNDVSRIVATQVVTDSVVANMVIQPLSR